MLLAAAATLGSISPPAPRTRRDRRPVGGGERVYGATMASSDLTPPFPDPGHGQPVGRVKRQEIADHLAALPLFGGCSKRELRHLAGLTRLHQLEAGQSLFEQGQPASAAYVVVAGEVEVRRDEGKVLARIGPGQVVGELGLLLRRAHSATVTAATPLEVIALSQAALKEAVEEVPGLAWNLLQAVAERLSADLTASE
jgi:CRP/FNR family transcriptional regulator, cyclic AMP receptor protein